MGAGSGNGSIVGFSPHSLSLEILGLPTSGGDFDLAGACGCGCGCISRGAWRLLAVISIWLGLVIGVVLVAVLGCGVICSYCCRPWTLHFLTFSLVLLLGVR